MDFSSLKDPLMFLVALYGAGLSTYNLVKAKPHFKVIYGMNVFAAPSSKKGVNFIPRTFSSITIQNTGSSSIFIGKFGFADEKKKFLSVELVDSSIVRVNNAVEPTFKGNEIVDISPTNECMKLITDDREIKPHSSSIVFFHAESLLDAINHRGAKKVYMYVSCGNTKKIVKINKSDLAKLEWVKRT